MSTGNPKDKLNDRRKRVRASDPDSQLLARMRRAIAPEKGKRSTESSDAESKPLSVHDEIYLKFQRERLDRCGFYRPPRRSGMSNRWTSCSVRMRRKPRMRLFLRPPHPPRRTKPNDISRNQ